MRCGPAGGEDGVEVRDFIAMLRDGENQPSSSTAFSTLNASAPNISAPTPGSWRTLPFGRKRRLEKLKSKSMTLPRINNLTPTKNLSSNRGPKGLVGRWKKLYRSSSWELRAYTHNHGHRSSIGVGVTAEYPDLECIPGIGDGEEFKRLGPGKVDGTTDANQHSLQPTAESRGLGLLSAPSFDSQAWTRTYRDCVGSLSALKTEVDLPNISS